MTGYRPELPPLPERMKDLPLDERGYPVPWFVTWIDGVPDFRVVDPDRLVRAHKYGLCWVCGGPLGSHRAFVVGPMCAVNRTSAEPPSHTVCADYAAAACPFLSRPHMRRRENALPADVTRHPASIPRNPGVALVWVTRKYLAFASEGQLLFRMGHPDQVRWYADGRTATRDEILASIDSGLPILREMAQQEGVTAVEELDRQHAVALALVPA